MSGETEDQWEAGEYASPACFLHELSSDFGIEPVEQKACVRRRLPTTGEAQAPDRPVPATDADSAAHS